MRDKAKAIKDKATKNSVYAYDMSSKEAREKQVKQDFSFAITEKTETTEKFVELNNYYNNRHYSKEQIDKLASEKGWNFTPPVLPDPYIQVESQVDPDIPQFQFKGRDDDLDSIKARERQEVVDFIVYNNKVDDLNLDNERILNENGNPFFKVSFDGSIKGPGFIGDIVIGNPDPANMFNDPSAYDVDDCEYLIYAFRMHRRKARRTYGAIVDDITLDSNHADTEIYENAKRSIDDETLQVVEYWYKDKEGDVACSVQINNVEVKHIPKYWVNTRHSGNKMYPFVKYCKIPVRKSFWDKGEIETIKDLVDASDRVFMTALLNDMFCANDIVLMEEDALAEGEEMSNVPGAVIKTRVNKINAVKRLGGVTNNTENFNMLNFIHDKLQETNGNFATRGAEPQRVTTASGLAQLREDRNARETVKKAGRLQGFRRLYQLIDWTALEFYNQDREILIRGKKEGEPDDTFTFNSDNHRVTPQAPQVSMVDMIKNLLPGNKPKPKPQPYYPKIDVEITAGDGIKQSKAFTLAATQELAKLVINPANKGIVISIVDLLDLPNKKEIKESIELAIPSQLPQEPGNPMGGLMPQGGPMQPPTGQMMEPEPDFAGFLQSLPQEIVQMILTMPDQMQEQHILAMMQLPPEELQAHMISMLEMGGGGIGQEAY